MLLVIVASLLAHRLRLIMTAVMIALGAGLVAGTFTLTDSVRGALSTSTAAASAPAVVVQPTGGADGKDGGAPTSLPDILAARIRAVRGVASAEGLVTAARLLRSGAARRGVRHRQHVFILTTQRTREYALLRVVGASRGQVLRSSLAGLGILAAAGLRGLIAVLGGTLLTAAEYRSARAADLGDISHVLALLTALVVLTEIIAVLGMANALALSVTERTREFAVMRALARREP